MKKLILFLSLLSLFAYADEYHISKTDDFIITKDKPNRSWNIAEWLYLKSTDKDQSRESKAKLMYSETGIYILFHNQDQKITATKKEDYTDLWNEDVVEVFLQPVLDYPLYFEYEISPLNKELFLLVPNYQNKFQGWQLWRDDKQKIGEIQHQVKILDNNDWIAEIFIPYELLKPLVNNPPKKGDIWKGNFYRIDYDNKTKPVYLSWQEVKGSFHQPEKFGLMIFN